MIKQFRSFWASITSPVRSAIAGVRTRIINAAYEAGMVIDDLWTLADFRDADATLLPHIRRRLRSRARYEYSNNPAVTRVVDIWADDVVSETGPWPKLDSGDVDADHLVEQTWLRWWAASAQAAKFRTAVLGEAKDGEAVALLFRNPRLLDLQTPGGGISLDVRGFEADRLADPDESGGNESNYVDGVHLDPFTGEAIAYDILHAHPGTEYFDALSAKHEATTFDARDVLHVFRKRRAEQNRGVCRYVSVLSFSGLLRKYFDAEAGRAGLTAALSVMFKSSAPPGDEEEEGGGGGGGSNWWQSIMLLGRRGVGCILPDGYEPVQMKADGAAAQVGEFRKQLAGLVAGCFSMPLGRALGQSDSGGYPGMRADLLPYHKAIASDRSQVWEPLYFVPLFRAFLQELRSTPAWVALMERRNSDPEKPYAPLDLMNVSWQWPERELVVDPSREDEAKRKRMAMGLLLREDAVDAPNLDEHDRRGARGLGLGDDDAAVKQYRQLCAKSIHQVQSLDGAAAGPPGQPPTPAKPQEAPEEEPDAGQGEGD